MCKGKNQQNIKKEDKILMLEIQEELTLKITEEKDKGKS